MLKKVFMVLSVINMLFLDILIAASIISGDQDVVNPAGITPVDQYYLDRDDDPEICGCSIERHHI